MRPTDVCYTSNLSATTRSPEPTPSPRSPAPSPPPPAPACPGCGSPTGEATVLLSALLVFREHPNGFTNKDLRALTTELRGTRPRQRFRRPDHLRPAAPENPRPDRPGPHSHRYTVTDEGLDTAKFLTLRPRPWPTQRPRRTRHPHTHPGPAPMRGHRLPPAIDTSPPQHNSRHERSRTDRITHLDSKIRPPRT